MPSDIDRASRDPDLPTLTHAVAEGRGPRPRGARLGVLIEFASAGFCGRSTSWRLRPAPSEWDEVDRPFLGER